MNLRIAPNRIKRVANFKIIVVTVKINYAVLVDFLRTFIEKIIEKAHFKASTKASAGQIAPAEMDARF